MTTISFKQSPQLYLRMAGILYLAIIVLGLFGEVFVRQALVINDDAGATMLSILPSQLLWRAGIAGDIFMHVFDVPVIVVLYLLLKPVNKGLALLATLTNLVQTAVLAANKLNLLIPLTLLNNSVYAQAFSAEQLHALAYLSISAHNLGFGIGLIFFGIACVLRGYLIFISNFLPKILGVLLVLAGLGYLINSFALILSPAFAALLFPGVLLPAFVGELALSLWMIFKGVNLDRWQQGSQL